jgi:hypothetical protein
MPSGGWQQVPQPNPGNPICEPPQPSNFSCSPGAYQYDVWAIPPTVTLNVSAVQQGPWISSSACDCALKPVGMVNECTDVTKTWSEEREVCWTVTGSATAVIKAGMIQALLLDAGIEIEIGGQWSHCKTITETMTFGLVPSQCFKRYARDYWIYEEREATGTSAAVARTWSCTSHTGQPLTITTYCNTQQMTATLKTFTGRGVEYSWPLKICGGADPPVGWDGKYDEACCHPICSEVVWPAQPCCGIIGSN